jgi:hypothetical protein
MCETDGREKVRDNQWGKSIGLKKDVLNPETPNLILGRKQILNNIFKGLLDCVCFFVLCNRHWFNKVPGPVTNLGIACLPSALTLALAVPT